MEGCGGRSGNAGAPGGGLVSLFGTGWAALGDESITRFDVSDNDQADATGHLLFSFPVFLPSFAGFLLSFSAFLRSFSDFWGVAAGAGATMDPEGRRIVPGLTLGCSSGMSILLKWTVKLVGGAYLSGSLPLLFGSGSLRLMRFGPLRLDESCGVS